MGRPRTSEIENLKFILILSGYYGSFWMPVNNSLEDTLSAAPLSQTRNRATE